jgi:hypothetical protein
MKGGKRDFIREERTKHKLVVMKGRNRKRSNTKLKQEADHKKERSRKSLQKGKNVIRNERLRKTYRAYTVKKGLRFSRSQPGFHFQTLPGRE